VEKHCKRIKLQPRQHEGYLLDGVIKLDKTHLEDPYLPGPRLRGTGGCGASVRMIPTNIVILSARLFRPLWSLKYAIICFYLINNTYNNSGLKLFIKIEQVHTAQCKRYRVHGMWMQIGLATVVCIYGSVLRVPSTWWESRLYGHFGTVCVRVGEILCGLDFCWSYNSQTYRFETLIQFEATTADVVCPYMDIR